MLEIHNRFEHMRTRGSMVADGIPLYAEIPTAGFLAFFFLLQEPNSIRLDFAPVPNTPSDDDLQVLFVKGVRRISQM